MNLRELEESLSVSDLSLGPAEELVGDVVLVTDVTALFLLVTERIGTLDLVWFPLVDGWLGVVVLG